MHIICHTSRCRLGWKQLKQVHILQTKTFFCMFVDVLGRLKRLWWDEDEELHLNSSSVCTMEETAYTYYWISYLNFHQLLCFLSYSLIQAANPIHGVCEMPSQTFDEENKEWGISSFWCERQFPYSPNTWSSFLFWFPIKTFMGTRRPTITICMGFKIIFQHI